MSARERERERERERGGGEIRNALPVLIIPPVDQRTVPVHEGSGCLSARLIKSDGCFLLKPLSAHRSVLGETGNYPPSNKKDKSKQRRMLSALLVPEAYWASVLCKCINITGCNLVQMAELCFGNWSTGKQSWRVISQPSRLNYSGRISVNQ